MKKRVTLFLIFLVSGYTFGQYQSLFGASSTEWKMSEYYVWMQYENYSIHQDSSFVLGTDTIFRVNNGLENCQSFIKQDLLNGKFYISNQPSGVYSLFMDLSLQVGEELSGQNFFFVPGSMVDSVYFDSNNLKHIRFIENCYPYTNYEFIEGVGSTRGISRTCWSGGSNQPILLCQYKDGLENYAFINEYVQNCNFTLVLDENNQQKLNVFPNPTKGILTIDIPQNLVVSEISVSNLLGQIVYTSSSFNKQLNLNFLETGNYFVNLMTSLGRVSWKVCIED